MYQCNICNYRCEQSSHHSAHIRTQKHKDCRRILELELSNLSNDELLITYNSSNMSRILQEKEKCIIKNEKEEIDVNCQSYRLSKSIHLSSRDYCSLNTFKERIHENFLDTHSKIELLSLLNKVDEINLLRTEGFNINIHITPKNTNVLVRNPWSSFNTCNRDYVLTPLGSFCKVLQKSSDTSNKVEVSGKYNFYDSTDIKNVMYRIITRKH